ncbi:hypothetical protein [Klebsiella michiganensis]|uniref:hypothetical protein n=1 Tax=Klebsiella michiganensis TaxID=1134687 RepID=UPI000667DED3|nr:hypothetical protein [Klebsiella michiganensis]MCW9490438.1 hypothetical protein [Klebsiella michiganensis]
MFRYFILRTEQQLFCYLYGIALALVLILMFYPVFPTSGFYLVALSVVLFWAGLALYTRYVDRMRKPEVSPLVSIRDGIQVVAMLPHHEKAQLEWEILQDDDVYRRQMLALVDLLQRVTSRGLIYAPAVMLAGMCILAWGLPQDATRLVNALRGMPAAELVHQTGFVLRSVLLISLISVLVADVVGGKGLPNAFRCTLLDRLPAEALRIRKGTER